MISFVVPNFLAAQRCRKGKESSFQTSMYTIETIKGVRRPGEGVGREGARQNREQRKDVYVLSSISFLNRRF